MATARDIDIYSDNQLVKKDVLKAYMDSLVPVGTVLPWFGSGENIPDGWHLCDGTPGIKANGKQIPDLQDRFILGVHTDIGGEGITDVCGSKGGGIDIKLTADQLPAHRHIFVTDDHAQREFNRSENDGGGKKYLMRPPAEYEYSNVKSWSADGSGDGRYYLTGSRVFTNSANKNNGSDTTSIRHIPPYVALYYIIKIDS